MATNVSINESGKAASTRIRRVVKDGGRLLHHKRAPSASLPSQSIPSTKSTKRARELESTDAGTASDAINKSNDLELDSKLLNVSASGLFYERAKSRRSRLRRALSENSTSQLEAIPLGGGPGRSRSFGQCGSVDEDPGDGSSRKKLLKVATRGGSSVLAPELPEAAVSAADTMPKPAACGVGARKRSNCDIDPHWNAILLQKKGREDEERRKQALRWRSSILKKPTLVRDASATSIGSAGHDAKLSGRSTEKTSGLASKQKRVSNVASKVASGRSTAGLGSRTGVALSAVTSAAKASSKGGSRAVPARAAPQVCLSTRDTKHQR